MPEPTPTPTPTPTPAPTTPFYSDWVKPDGTLNQESFSRLPDDIKYFSETLKQYPTAEGLVRGFAATKHFAGQKGLIPLDANAPAEARATRKALMDGLNGVPPKPAEYGIVKPKDLPDEQWSQPLADNFMAWAHENSVSPAAAKKLVYDIQGNAVKSQLAQQQQHATEFQAAQRQRYEDQLRLDRIPLDRAEALVERAAAALGYDLKDPRDVMALSNAKTRLAMVRYAIGTGEDKFIKSDDDKAGGGDVQAAYDDIVHNKANPLYAPLYNQRHPQHAMAKEKVNSLAQAIAARMKAK